MCEYRLADDVLCKARPCADDASSLTALGTMFVATMVDAKDFIVQLEATFCNVLWPAFCSVTAKSRSRAVELEKRLDGSRKELDAREVERVRMLSEIDVLRAELEHERLRFRIAVEEAKKTSREKGLNDELEKSAQENVVLQRRIEELLEMNSNQEKQLQSLAKDVEELQKKEKLSSIKQQFLQDDNQRLGETRAACEKLRLLQSRRLTLRHHTRLSKEKSPVVSPCIAGLVVDGNSEDPPALQSKDPVQFPSNQQPQPSLRVNNQVNQDPTGSGSESNKNIEKSAVLIEADKTADRGAVFADTRRSNTPQGGLDVEGNPGPRSFDSDETVMEAVEVASCPVDIATSNQGPVLLPRTVVAVEAIKSGPEDTRFSTKTAPQVSTEGRPRTQIPLASVSQKLATISSRQSWRQTRCRAEPCEGDPHDSFLDTPRERALALLAATREQTERTQNKEYAVESPAASRTKELVLDALETARAEKAAARPERSNARSRPVTEAKTSVGQERKEIDARLGSKGPAYKFNEPVRKKRDRELLQATDCKQCRKFYDAVEAGDKDGMMLSLCEHHDAVSRHRFKFLPPATPDGFWNIGFDSDVQHC